MILEKEIFENFGDYPRDLKFEPYCIKFDEEFKERVREYFNRCCYVCAKNEIGIKTIEVTENKDFKVIS